MKRWLLMALLGIIPIFLWANYFSYLPYTITQPDGEVIHCFVSGDEHFNWLHDEAGYTIIQQPDGYYYYGVVSGDEVVATTYKVNSVNPAKISVDKWVKISEKAYSLAKSAYEEPVAELSAAPHSGTLNNIVVYIRFSDDTEFETTRQTYDSRFNSMTAASLKSYYNEVSYGVMTVSSTHYPECALTTNLSYQDAHPRAYYEPYNETSNPIGYEGGNNGSERTQREHTLLKNAMDWMAANSPVPASLNLDGDGDNYIDNVCFIIKGGNGAWNALLWAHSWSLYSYSVYINGKRLYKYTFQPETQCNVQTLCHEMFHAIGAPDLYHYTGNGINPVGSWDLMEYGSGHMGAYMKWRYSNNTWISTIPEITTSGTYSLHPLASATNNCYKIRSPFSDVQFFLVEYRKKTGLFENNVPGSGLLVYRIDSRYSGNASGPPDGVYIYRPDGTTTVNGSYSQAYFSSDVGRVAINDTTNPSGFLQDGSLGGLNISDITSAGDSISFTVNFSEVFNPSQFTASAVAPTEIDLTWNLNGDGDQVLLAYSTSSDFGTPDNFSTYSVGDTLTGGGTVLLTGTSTTFNHVNLEPGETFYYKIWSVSNEEIYSQGLERSASTWCTIVSDFPYAQHFNNAKKPGCWYTSTGVTNPQTWEFGTISGLDTLPVLAGNYAYLNSYAYGSGYTQNADLISPYFDFMYSKDITVSFDHYFLNKQSSTGTFYYSTNYGQTWVEVQQFNSTSGNNPEHFSIDLTNELKGSTYVRFKWNYSGSYERYWAIDNVVVDAAFNIEDTLEVTEGEFGEGIQCFNAYQSIVVADGRSTVEFYPFSSADFIAGKSIRFLPGFHAHEMSNIHAYITTDSTFCSSGSGGTGQIAEAAKSEEVVRPDDGLSGDRESLDFNVYPNPNNGSFTIELTGDRTAAEISLYNLVGAKVATVRNVSGKFIQMDVRPLDSGMYFVSLCNGERRVVKKIIVR